MGQLRDLTGQTFGRLTAIRPDGQNKHRQTFWICQCSCGKEVRVIGYNLTQGQTRSCGCLVNDSHYIKHNGKKEFPRLYRIWKKMRERCRCPSNVVYNIYGGRGITVCESWDRDFISFRDWSLANGYADNLTIDRIDPNGNYCPENCRWVTQYQQNLNKRDTLKVTYQGEIIPLKELSERVQMNYRTLYRRIIIRGMTPEEAIAAPLRKKHSLTFQGETKTLKEWSEITGITYDTLMGRQKAGKSPEEILSKH